MDLAAFSDIEYVGIAADRHIVVYAGLREQTDSRSSSSTISLASVDREIERHDQTLTASALDIREVYTVMPLSPSALVVDLVPDTLRLSADDGHDTTILELDLPPASSPSDALPLDRYRHDPQRHERVAVSVALGRPCDLAAPDIPAFRRSPAPSPSPGRVLDLYAYHQQNDNIQATAADAITVESVVDADDHDYQARLRTYTLERWFGSPMEKTQELAVELQQRNPQSPRLEPSFLPSRTSLLGAKPGISKTNAESPISSIALDPIEPDPTVGVKENIDTDETLEAFNRNYQLNKERRVKAGYRTYRAHTQRKRKSEEDHPQPRPTRPSPP